VAIALAALVVAPACGDGDANDPETGAGGDATQRCKSLHGSAMARVEVEGESFCIDRTEVTRDDYAAFLAAGAPTPPAPPGLSICAAPNAHLPDASCLSTGTGAAALCKGESCGSHAQTCVTFCDAVAFCAWAGKTLCGPKGGGYGVSTTARPLQDRWLLACGDGLRADGAVRVRYGYAGEYEPGRCSTDDNASVPVGSKPRCSIRSDASVLDMVGGVQEWTGTLFEDNETTKTAVPVARGGASFGLASGRDAECSAGFSADTAGREADPSVGIRCCKDAD